MSTVECRKCGRDAEYTCSLRKGDVHKCDRGHKTIYPLHVES